jgi:spermidine synthase
MSRPFVYTGVFFVQLATLMLEILLTRIISVIAWYHLAFFVISLVMLGMTAGAVMVFVSPRWFPDEAISQRLAQSTLGFAIAIPIAIGFTLSQPLMPVTDLMSFLALLWTGGLLAVPFIMSGVAIALALTRSGLPPSIVYGVDLCGAATGCLLVIPLLDLVDAPSAAILCGALAAFSALIFARAARRRVAWPLFIAVLLTLLGSINANFSLAGLRPAWAKGVREDPKALSYVGWNTYSRVTVGKSKIEIPMIWAPSYKIPLELLTPIPWRDILIDGAARTMMAELGNSIDNHSYIGWDLTSFVHFLRPSGSVAVIGVGGGRDILDAVRVGHKEVVGIEINQLIVNLHKDTMRNYSGIASLPGVEIVADEARSYLSRDSRSYDVIMMSLIDTWASTGAGAYSLSENGLYTLEAWMTFLSRLKPNGIFTVSRWYNPTSPGETARMTALAMEALWAIGAVHPALNIIVLQHHTLATLLVSRQRFSTSDLKCTHKEAERLGYTVLVAPYQETLDPIMAEVIRKRTSRELWQFASSQVLDLTPPTDNRPFFFNMLKPTSWFAVSRPVGALDMSFLGNLQATQTLIYSIAVSLILTLITIIAPLFARRRDLRATPRSVLFAASAYFALIGIGFMYVEMAMLSRLNVLIGHPTLALAVLLGGIILFTGVGSLLSAFVSIEQRIVAVLYPFIPAVLLCITGWFMHSLEDAMSATTAIRVAISIALIAPSALGLGLCFPLGLRLVERTEKALQSEGKKATLGPWLWGINGAFGVCASGLALGTSMVWGIQTTLVAGAVCYFILPLASWRLARSTK